MPASTFSSGSRQDESESVFRSKSRLFAEFIRSDAIKLPMAIDGNGFLSIGVDGVIGAFAESMESVSFQIFRQITPVYRQGRSPPGVAQSKRCEQGFLYRAADRPRPSHGAHRGA